MSTAYIVRMTDLDALPPDIDALAHVSAVLGQDSGECTLRLVTEQPEALEAAMDDCDDVQYYEQQTYCIEVRDDDGRWVPAPGESDGLTREQAEAMVAGGVPAMDGSGTFAPADVRIVEE